MFVARNKDGQLWLFNLKPVRNLNWKDSNCLETIDKWSLPEDRGVRFGSYDSLYRIDRQMMRLPDELFLDLTWNDEPVEVVIIEKKDIKYEK